MLLHKKDVLILNLNYLNYLIHKIMNKCLNIKLIKLLYLYLIIIKILLDLMINMKDNLMILLIHLELNIIKKIYLNGN
jgi:hypothetical protein